MSMDWSSLPRDLVNLILQNLTKIQDNIRFCAVCKPWFNVGQDQKLERMKTVTHNQPPLILTTNFSSSNFSYSLYDIEERKTYVNFLEKGFNSLMPSSFGWFGRFTTWGVYLINPFARKTIHFSEFIEDEFKFVFFKQVILSDDPSLNPNSYMVCGIDHLNGIVHILRSSDKSWKKIGLKNIDSIAHASFHKGHLYLIDLKDSLIKINLDYKYSDAPIVECLIQRHFQHNSAALRTLVESVDGELLCIQRFEFKGRTMNFKVFKLGESKDGENEPKWDWIKMESLGNQTLFVGFYYSKSIPSGDNLSPNSIYYAYNGNNVGIFSFEDQSKHLFYDFVDHKYISSVWISPTLP